MSSVSISKEDSVSSLLYHPMTLDNLVQFVDQYYVLSWFESFQRRWFIMFYPAIHVVLMFHHFRNSLTVFFFQVHKLIDLFRKEADYWQRRRGLEPPPPHFQQVQSRPRLQRTFQNHNHEVCESTMLVAL